MKPAAAAVLSRVDPAQEVLDLYQQAGQAY